MALPLKFPNLLSRPLLYSRSKWKPSISASLPPHFPALFTYANPSNLLQSHAFLLRHNLFIDPILYTKLLALFSLSNLDYARRIFDFGPHKHDSFLCNIILKEYKEKGRFFDEFKFYKELRRKGFILGDGFTMLSLAKCCGGIGCVWGSGQVHLDVIRDGFGSDLYVGTAVVDMYVKVGAMGDARKVFDGIRERSLALILYDTWEGG
ncbi:hypothetical protein Droror1_Dr00025019 [Drosera rotundifolia]